MENPSEALLSCQSSANSYQIFGRIQSMAAAINTSSMARNQADC